MVLILIQQQFPSTFFCCFVISFSSFPSPSPQPFALCRTLQSFYVHSPSSFNHFYSEYTSWWHFFPSHSTPFFPSLRSVCFYAFRQSWKKKIKSKSYTQREGDEGEKTVMPDAICVPNNNKAIHHLNMCRCARHVYAMHKGAKSFAVCSHSINKFPSLFNREGFSAFCVSFSPSPRMNVSTTFCALMMFFMPFLAIT